MREEKKEKDISIEETKTALELIRKFTSGDYSTRSSDGVAGEHNELINRLNALGEKLNNNIPTLVNFNERINSILQVLLRYTVMDFSLKAEISPAGDELDAIALGLNTLAEELDVKSENEIRHIETLNQLNQFLHNVLENIPVAVMIKDTRDLKYLRINKAGEEIYGKNREHVLGRKDREIFSADEAGIMEKYDQEVIASGKLTVNSEFSFSSPAGIKWLQIKRILIEDEEGHPVFILFISEDITASKQTLQKLRESEERFRVLVEQVKDYAIFMLNTEGYVSSWNEGAQKIKGYDADEIIGKHASIFYADVEIKRGEPWYNLAQAELHGSFSTTGIRKRKDGTVFWAHVVITALYDQNKKLKGFTKVTRDITEQRKAQETENELKRKLEQKVDELGAVNSELESFSYSVSHDLRAPLRAINGYMQILLRDSLSQKLTPDEKHLMNQVVLNAGRMSQLIDDLLNFSRLGKKRVEYFDVDMTSLARNMKLEIARSMDVSRTEFTIDDLPKAQGDESLLAQVFLNLYSNAVKYSSVVPAPKIEIGSLEKDGELVYYVKDNGIGFDMKFYHKLFNVFQRLHDISQFEGTGVGLAIVKRIIEKHGGRIWAESARGKGATFFFVLKEKEKR